MIHAPFSENLWLPITVHSFLLAPTLSICLVTHSALTSNAACYEMQNVEAESPKAAWCQLSARNIENLVRIANKAHPDLPERDQVFAERLKLFPKGCLALVEIESGELHGYAISHPIRCRQPPALNSFLGEVASDAD